MKIATVRRLKLFTITLSSILILYAALKFALFYIIGWQDSLNLDWYTVYYPAIHNIINPFVIYGYFNPPWLAWLLSPLGLLTAVDGHTLWIVLILLLTVRCVYELGGGMLAVILTIISPGFLVTIVNGQIDVLVLLGLLIGSWLLVLIKPQVAGLAIVYDVIVERRIDWTAVIVGFVSLVVFVAFMTWPIGPELKAWNITPWPYGIPVGIVLFILSVRRRDKWLAAVATFFFTPYLSGSSLLVYSAIMTSKYGRIVAVLFAALLWVACLGWFL